MSEQIFGGIVARPWNINTPGWYCFAEGAYSLYRYLGRAGDKVSFQNLPCFTAFASPARIWQGVNHSGDFLLETDELWLAGARGAGAPACGALKRSSKAYKVQKPWGAELWLSCGQPGYCFKQIHIRRGHRTSLQLHRFKRETNVLVEGKLRLHFRNGESGFSVVDLDAPIALEIPPGCVHRMEALSDLLFLEISTPEVDDVIRLEDDAGRPNGRIESEHGRL